MYRKISVLLIAFWVLCMVHLLSLLAGPDWLRYSSKPFLVTFLALYFFRETRGAVSHLRLLFLAALVFSVLGDTWLLFPGPQFFLLGLGCFLITQLGYLAAFLSYRSSTPGYLQRRPGAALPLLLYLGLLIAYLWPDLPPAFRAPVLVYSVVITAMALGALHLRDALPQPLFRRLFAGTLFFLLSDSLIAFSRFKANDPAAPLYALLIMATYLLAQYMIATSAVTMTRGSAFVAEEAS